MAWNEPGGGNNKDPWGDGGNNQGPPDLDEAFKKLQEKRNGIFSGGGSSSGSGSGKQFSGGLIVVILLIVALIWAALGIYQVNEKDRAVVLRFGKYHVTHGPGLHWNPPLIDQVQTVRVTEERQYPSRGVMLTEDENIVDVPLDVQYNVADAKAFVLNVKNPDLSLQHATDSALRHVVGGSNLDDVVSSGREEIGYAVKARLQEYLDNYGTGIQVIKVNIQEAKPPKEVKAAYDDVIKAREDQERLINEAQAYANGIIPEARGASQRVLEEASAHREKVIVEAQGEAKRFEQLLVEYKKAPGVTRERLYLDAVQSVMNKSSKVLIDVEGGNNMLYLPLDKMMQHGSTVSTDLTLDEQNLNDITNEVIRRIQQAQTAASRRREVR